MPVLAESLAQEVETNLNSSRAFAGNINPSEAHRMSGIENRVHQLRVANAPFEVALPVAL